MSASRKRIAVFSAAAVVAVAGGLYTHHHDIFLGAGVTNAQANPAPQPPAAQVDVAPVVARTITDWQSYSGRLEAVDRVDVRPQVSGTIVAVHFKDGALVKKGDLLFTIDPRPYAAEVDRAAAQLASAEARAGYTATDKARAERLIADNAIAKRDFDEKQNAAREAAAGVKAAQAQLESARINLEYTRVVAPVAGRVSRAEMTVGNIVSSGANAPLLTTLVSVSPIYASFDVDEQTYLRYLSHDNGRPVPVDLGLADESGFSRKGTVSSIDNQLDTRSGTIRVRASINNADGALVPGLYARIRVGGGAPHQAVLIDDKAIGTDQDRNYVMVVGADQHASYRRVTLGNQQDGLRVITSGLAPGDRIVVNGLQRIRPNDLVQANPVSMDNNAVGTVTTSGTSGTADTADAGKHAARS